MHLHVYVCMYVRMRACMYLCICLYAYTCIYVRMYTYMYVCEFKTHNTHNKYPCPLWGFEPTISDRATGLYVCT